MNTDQMTHSNPNQMAADSFTLIDAAYGMDKGRFMLAVSNVFVALCEHTNMRPANVLEYLASMKQRGVTGDAQATHNAVLDYIRKEL